ncbi:MAG: hypothetical protein AB7J63_04295 [Vicinamibacterales bacterium]
MFLLSPANCGGRRGSLLLGPSARFELARRLREPAGVPLGEVFSFVSGLYFRGKLTYARRFAAPDDGGATPRVLVITPTAGLQRPETSVTASILAEYASVDVSAENSAYRLPLETSARALDVVSRDRDVVLLGSIATPKYVEVLTGIFGARLQFPAAFVGRGDMSRGGLLLRHAAAGVELEYVAVAGAVRRGPRPPKLPPQLSPELPPQRQARVPTSRPLGR